MKILTTLTLLVCVMVSLTAQEITFSTTCETIEFCASENDCGPVSVSLIAEATTTCASGGLAINYTIDLNDDGSIDVSGVGNMINDNYPLGNHRVMFTATDGCGNEEVCDFLFLVEDCTAPVVLADSFMIREIDGGAGGVMILASEVDNGSSDNCGLSTMLIVSPSQGPGQTEPPSEAIESWFFSCCCDYGNHSLDLWVSDEAGNWSYSTGFVLVGDNLAPFCSCNPPTFCTESVTEDGAYIDDVNYLVDYSGLWSYTLSSGECGEYSSDVPTIITPEKNTFPLNGVSTFDLILIARHVLGVESLDSPYKIIAADVNKSSSVTTLDMVVIRKLILGIDTEFTNNTSWRFIDEDFDFPNEQDPWQSSFPESITGGACSSSSVEFIAIKVGDVNGTANFDPLPETISDQRNVSSFEIPNYTFEKGELVDVDFYAKGFKGFKDFVGFQFALDYKTNVLDFKNIKKGTLEYLDENNFGIKEKEGTLSASWINMDFDQIEIADEPLFSLQFKALQSGMLKDLLQLSNTSLSPEVYTHDLVISNLAIHFKELTPNLNLKTNPNPFFNETTIQFDLPNADRVSLKVMDAKGKVVKEFSGEYDQGFNEININANLFPAKGIYFYHIKTSTESRSGKFIKS